jgi:benzoate/toluate 1,2-dioxygenase subunit beta
MPDLMSDEATALVAREAWLLDQQDWDAWLDLYLPDAEYWLPCYLEDGTMSSDPNSQISLIYYSSRAGLEDRIFRIRTGQSLASTPLPRTAHVMSCGHVAKLGNGDIEVGSSWASFSYRLEQSYHFFGTQKHVLRRTEAGLKIAKRHIIVMNDKIPCPLDIYSV